MLYNRTSHKRLKKIAGGNTMIRVLIGPKGTGKTKTFINMANEALQTEKGNVVCITKGSRHTFDISSDIRLVNTDDFNIVSVKELYGFISGMIAQNYDITHIFIDSITKITNATLGEVSDVVPALEKIAADFNVDFTIAISEEKEGAPENIIKYAVNI